MDTNDDVRNTVARGEQLAVEIDGLKRKRDSITEKVVLFGVGIMTFLLLAGLYIGGEVGGTIGAVIGIVNGIRILINGEKARDRYTREISELEKQADNNRRIITEIETQPG